MSAREFLEAVQSILETAGGVLLEITAVLVLSYLLVFAGSLLVAAVQRSADRHGWWAPPTALRGAREDYPAPGLPGTGRSRVGPAAAAGR